MAPAACVNVACLVVGRWYVHVPAAARVVAGGLSSRADEKIGFGATVPPMMCHVDDRVEHGMLRFGPANLVALEMMMMTGTRTWERVLAWTVPATANCDCIARQD